jgi:3-hydroxyacyl-[acyl-carrier-protein] dehydratase
MPVVPGVCQTQLIKEILQEETKKNLVLSKGTNIKFMAMIVPQEHPKLSVEIGFKKENDIYSVDAKLFFDAIIFTKFKGEFILG